MDSLYELSDYGFKVAVQDVRKINARLPCGCRQAFRISGDL